MTSTEILIRAQPTPNPYAWKFILNQPVLNEGKASYGSPEEAEPNNLARSLFQIPGIKQVHFFQNTITVTHSFDEEFENIKEAILSVIQTRMVTHNPHQTVKDEKILARANLPEDLRKIEEILDRTVRPGLQGDGGDIEIIKLDDNKLYVHYEGACGTCPSSTSGTLMAIESIMKEEFNPNIEVIPL